MSNHRLAISTHNRLNDFRRLLSHIRSYDELFANILIVVDGDYEYFEQIDRIVSSCSIGCNNYELFHSNQIGGAAVRNYMIADSIRRNYKFLSFLDDDDIPFKQKFINAEIVLNSNKSCLGYTSGYYRYYGPFGRRVITKDTKIGLRECRINNDIGGFSFVTLNLQYIDEDISIPNYLKSNQDWFLWLMILKKHPSKYFWKEGSLVGLIYNDIRSRKNRLTLDASNLSSTHRFYLLLKDEYGLELEGALDYFYYKYLRQKGFISFIRAIALNRDMYGLSFKHWRSLLFNIIYNGFKRLFLSKTSVSDSGIN